MTCSYCRVSSFIQRARAPQATRQQIPAGAPVIHVRERRASGWLVLLAAAAIAILTGVALYVREKTLVDVALLRPPVLFDVNGDGTEDALLSALVTGSPNVHVRALDGTTGETLWKTDALGKGTESIGLVGDTLLFFSASRFRGFDARTGKERFVRDLPEHVANVCEDQLRWFLLTEDKQVHAVDPASGALTPGAPAGLLRATPGNPACTPAWYSAFQSHGRLIRSDSSPSHVRVEGMNVSSVLTFGEGALPSLVLGSREQGSGIPMLAGTRDGRTLWKLELPGSAPLEVYPGAPEAATIAAARVYASYERSETRGFTLVSVALSNGQRVWETAVPRERNPTSLSLRASERHVFALADSSLYAFSANDGRMLWRVGWDPGS